MKKIYVMPQMEVVEVKIQSLLVDYSNGEASSSATTLSRENKSGWDED